MKAMLFEKLIDRKDRKKIRKRTRQYGPDYNFRLQFEGFPDKSSFSFLVVGDSGAGDEKKRMKYHVADSMALEPNQDLILHLGDLVYLSGSKQGYPVRFIKTYRHWLLNKENHSYKNMIFTKPFLPIYGNHDYYDFGKILPGIGQLLGLLHDAIGSGSKTGKIFEKAFIESKTSKTKLKPLPYRPNHHTRIPNRYYWFTHGPCAFFALDSNTLDIVDEPSRNEKKTIRKQLEKIESELEKGRKIVEEFIKKEEKGEIDESYRPAFERIFFQIADREKKAALLKKRLDANKKDHDIKQLDWLKSVLQHEDVKDKWKIVYLHHSMYSSESGHTDDIATGGLRENLRKILTDHKVNLILSGHSHCFEWVKRKLADKNDSDNAKALAEAEQNICYIVSGGGGQGLRESVLEEDSTNEAIQKKQKQFLDVAESLAYTSIIEELKTEGVSSNVHNYVKIEASEDSLKVIPVGVIEKEKEAYRLPQFYTKVFNQNDLNQKPQFRKLKAIHVFKDKPAMAEWE